MSKEQRQCPPGPGMGHEAALGSRMFTGAALRAVLLGDRALCALPTIEKLGYPHMGLNSAPGPK